MIGIVNNGEKKDYPVEQEQNMTMQQVQNAFGQTAIQLGSIADSLGVMSTAIKKHETAIVTLDEKLDALREDHEREKQLRKDRERIEEDEVNSLSMAIKNRVTDLLREHDRFDLFGRFTAQCRNDARKYSYYRGIGGRSTKFMYYQELLDYVGNWTPEHWGVVGYINHLDSLRESK